jgi:hypothetical protein
MKFIGADYLLLLLLFNIIDCKTLVGSKHYLIVNYSQNTTYNINCVLQQHVSTQMSSSGYF